MYMFFILLLFLSINVNSEYIFMLSFWGCLGKGSWVSLGEEIHSSSFFPQQCCCAGNWQCACLFFEKERAGISFERYPCNPNFMFLIKMYSQKCLISEKCVMRRDRWSIPTQKCHNLVMALGVVPRIKHHTYFCFALTLWCLQHACDSTFNVLHYSSHVSGQWPERLHREWRWFLFVLSGSASQSASLGWVGSFS